MFSWLFDPDVHLTNEEFHTKYPDQEQIDVQTVVEAPHFYILGRSSDTMADQLSYVDERWADTFHLGEPVLTTHVMRSFTGDGPARGRTC
jgi:hypothetical protein